MMMNRFILLLIVLVYTTCSIALSVPIQIDTDKCSSGQIFIAESIPVALNLTTNATTYQSWLDLINDAQESIDMGMFYMTLTDGGDLPSEYGGYMGMNIYKAIINAHSRGVKVRIVQNEPNPGNPGNDTAALAKLGAAEVRSIDWSELVGSGILHTKLMVVDRRNAYVGSANYDWRSLAQVKELGVVVLNCKTLVEDTKAAFEQYWDAADMTQLPTKWSSKYDAKYNQTHPAQLSVNGGEDFNIFLAASPPEFVSKRRTGDIDALVNAINNANESICISVMDYAPTSFYNNPNTFWPVIDDALRAAAFNRGVNVRLLISHWNHTNMAIIPQFLNSLDALTNVEVRWFQVPDFPYGPQQPYTRVNHAKYMVTEQQSYVGTSNWSEDYFVNTGGLSYNIVNANFTSQLQAIFNRDWNSPYALPLSDY